MPINPFKPGGVNIEIELDKPEGPYFPGDNVEIVITLTPEKDMHVDTFWCGMHAWERITTEDSDGYSTQWTTVDEYVTRETLRENFDLKAGVLRTYSLRLWVPSDAFPPAQGISISAGWEIQAHLELGLKRDIQHSVTLPLLIPPAGDRSAGGEYGKSSHPKETNMRLQLPGLEFSEGEVIEGELAVEARNGINTNEVRIQLLRKELGHGRRVRTSHTMRVKQFRLAGKARLKAGGSYAYPFKFEIPIQKCPSRSTPSATISYILQGVLNRRLRRDVCVDVPVTLYSSQRTE